MYKLLIKNKHYMRRIVSLFICCISAFVMYAQTEHMKFMGIPLNGTISSFQSKLLSKGIKYDEVLSRHLGVGCRCFNGKFSGEKANIYVYYNDKTKTVYRAKAVIECSSKSIGENKYKEFETMLNTKYSNGIKKDGEQDGHPSLLIAVPNEDETDVLGTVGMYISNAAYSYMDEVYLHIDYSDYTNEILYRKSNMDDL